MRPTARLCARGVAATALGILAALAGVMCLAEAARAAERFEGRYYSGEGDREFLQLLDISRRMFEPDPEWQNLPMLYTPQWNGWVEGPTWGAWWIQNSYGPSYCAIPFWMEPYSTFLQNSQDLWFRLMGDGKRKGDRGFVAPDGCLCDAATPETIYYRQGDGRVDIHDWGMEFTAAGVVMQAELLLAGRDAKAIAHYVPLLERSANFIESRRDPQNNLFLAGAAGNLLAPSYAGAKLPDGKYAKAYLAGLSVTYIAGLDRLIELEKMAGRAEKVQLYTQRRDLARKGLLLLTTDEGYFVKSIDTDGTKHGVFGAKKHGYFEAVTNHDAICFRVADDAQSERIYRKIASIPELRRHDLVITSAPSLDDMYEAPVGLWEYGRWVNGGHWTTCEARMIMAYFRLGRYDDAQRSMKRIVGFAEKFRLDNPLVDFGANVYQPGEPINTVYDSWGAPAAMIRGLFEYLYDADGVTIVPHVPPGIAQLSQKFPIRFGAKRLFLSTSGSGPITSARMNGRPLASSDGRTVRLVYADTPRDARIHIHCGAGEAKMPPPLRWTNEISPEPSDDLPALTANLFPLISRNDLPLVIGASTDRGNRFRGEIGPCRVFSRALAAKEVAALAQDKPGTLDADPALVGAWRFEAAKQNAFANARGEQLPAKIVGPLKIAKGPHGGSIVLDGNCHVEVANDPRLQLTSAVTMEAWIKPGQLDASGGRIIDKCRVGTCNGYMIDVFPGSLRMIVEWGVVNAAVKTDPGKWLHVAGTVSPDGTLSLYADGKLAGQTKVAAPPDIATLRAAASRLRKFHAHLIAAGLEDSYEVAHARLAVNYVDVCRQRMRLLAEGKLRRLPEASQYAADRLYFSTAAKLTEGLQKTLESYAKSTDSRQKKIHALWQALAPTRTAASM